MYIFVKFSKSQFRFLKKTTIINSDEARAAEAKQKEREAALSKGKLTNK